MIGRGEFLSRHFVLTRGVKLICEKLGFKKMCAHFLFAIVGHNSDEFLEVRFIFGSNCKKKPKKSTFYNSIE